MRTIRGTQTESRAIGRNGGQNEPAAKIAVDERADTSDRYNCQSQAEQKKKGRFIVKAP
jgi:hypothetical protein